MKRRSLAFAAAANMSIVSFHPTDLDASRTLSHSVDAQLGPRRLLAFLREASSWPSSMRASPLTCRKVGEIPALMQSDMSCSAADCMLGLFGSAAVIDAHNDGARPWRALEETSARNGIARNGTAPSLPVGLSFQLRVEGSLRHDRTCGPRSEGSCALSPEKRNRLRRRRRPR
jgi:hypothetical protein